jgi:hypothetical protein
VQSVRGADDHHSAHLTSALTPRSRQLQYARTHPGRQILSQSVGRHGLLMAGRRECATR